MDPERFTEVADVKEWHECTLLDCLGGGELLDVQEGVGKPPHCPTVGHEDSTWIMWVFGRHGETWCWRFLAVEDPEDGYRSCLDSLYRQHIRRDEISPSMPPIKGTMTVSPDGWIIGFRTVQKQEILTVGTDGADDYYPAFVASWNPPKAEETEEETSIAH